MGLGYIILILLSLIIWIWGTMELYNLYYRDYIPSGLEIIIISIAVVIWIIIVLVLSIISIKYLNQYKIFG